MGKGGNATVSKPSDVKSTAPFEGSEWMIIDGVQYDVGQFKRKHPGGNVLRYMFGKDATHVYNEFHARSRKADVVLKSLPSRPVSSVAPAVAEGLKDRQVERDAALLADYDKLRAEFVAEGAFSPSLPHVAYRVVELVALFAVAFGLLARGHWWAGMLLAGYSGGRGGWVQHEGGHCSLTGNAAIDKQLQKFSIGFGLMCAGGMWNHMHFKHHATPQHEGKDMDLDTMPLVAFYKEALTNSPRRKLASPTWVAWQPISYIIFTCSAVTYFWNIYLHPRFVLRNKDWVTPLWWAARVGAHVAAAGSVGGGLKTLAASMYFSGIYLFWNFSLSHTHTPVIAEDDHVSWVRYALSHTVNITPSWWCNHWMGYLNCQIEHHLFPTMPQYRQPAITHRVAALAEKHGLEYQTMSYWTACKKTWMNLYNVAGEAALLKQPRQKKSA